MADRRVWELVAGSRVVGHCRWVGGRELVADAPWPLARQLEAWFYDRTRVAGRNAVKAGLAEGFFTEELPERFAIRCTPLGPPKVPTGAAWLLALDDDTLPALGRRDPFGWASNRWDPAFDLGWLVTATAKGEVRWGRGAFSGFKAGGRCPDSAEMWLTLAPVGDRYALVVRHRRWMWGRPVVQGRGWVFRTQLQRIHGVLEGRL